MQSALQPRTVVHEGIIYHVVKLTSSGVGSQYACSFYPSGKAEVEATGETAQVLLLTEESVEKDQNQRALFIACARRFDDHLTFAKYLGSSSFWQSQVPPDGIGKPDSK